MTPSSSAMLVAPRGGRAARGDRRLGGVPRPAGHRRTGGVRAAASHRAAGRPAAVELARPGAVVVELCCGVAAVASAIAAEVPDAEVYAADVDPAEVAVARRNLRARTACSRATSTTRCRPACEGGSMSSSPTRRTCRPARSRTCRRRRASTSRSSRSTAGADGLDVQRRVAAGARDWLAPGGSLLIETSVRQAPATADAMRAGGLEPRVVRDDELDATAVIGRRLLAQHRRDDREREAGQGQQRAHVVPRRATGDRTPREPRWHRRLAPSRARC